MMKYLALYIFLLSNWSGYVFAKEAFLIDQFLKEVQKNSILYQQTFIENSAANVNSSLSLNDFNWSGLVSYNYFDVEEVAFSPFSPEKITKSTYNLNVTKKWEQGLTSSLNYTLVDNLTDYPMGTQLDYLQPDLNLTLSTDLVQDVFYRKSQAQVDQVNSTLTLNTLQMRQKQKEILVGSLLRLANTLASEVQLDSQQQLCQELKSQVNKLYNKSRSGIVSQRDYLLSLKKKNNCFVQINTIDSQIKTSAASFRVDYGLSYADYKNISLSAVTDKVIPLYQQQKQTGQETFDVNATLNMRRLTQELESVTQQIKRLGAESKPAVNLSLTLGAKGLDNDFDSSHEDVSELSNPYVSGTVSVDLPFTNKRKADQLKAMSLQKQLLDKKIKVEKTSQTENFNNLKERIELQLQNLELVDKNIGYSKSALRVATKDFNNGRIDFLSLSEFQSQLIESEVELVAVHLNLIVDIISYLDHYNFFERYY